MLGHCHGNIGWNMWLVVIKGVLSVCYSCSNICSYWSEILRTLLSWTVVEVHLCVCPNLKGHFSIMSWLVVHSILCFIWFAFANGDAVLTCVLLIELFWFTSLSLGLCRLPHYLPVVIYPLEGDFPGHLDSDSFLTVFVVDCHFVEHES